LPKLNNILTNCAKTKTITKAQIKPQSQKAKNKQSQKAKNKQSQKTQNRKAQTVVQKSKNSHPKFLQIAQKAKKFLIDAICLTGGGV
jgi:hypothetical protein